MNSRSNIRKTALVALAVASGSVLWWAAGQGQTANPSQTAATASDLSRLQPDERNTVELVQRYSDSVVYVSVHSNPQGTAQSGNDPFTPFQQQPRDGTGSGFVLDAKGFILTNNHVVDGADSITVKFKSDPKNYTAKVIATAAPLDIALIKVDAPSSLLKPVSLADSDRVLTGEKVVAIGNPFGLESSVSTGIVSAVRKNPGAVESLVPMLIQTDAAINPGNSGGPLLNSRGEVIGINTAIISPSGMFGNAQNSGVGFSIPINLVKQYLGRLEQGQSITSKEVLASQPRLGLQVFPLSAYSAQAISQNKLPNSGLMVQKVEANTPASGAGFKEPTQFLQVQGRDGSVQQVGLNGDILLEANGTALSDINDLRSVLNSLKTGEAVSLKVWREGKEISLKVVPRLIKS